MTLPLPYPTVIEPGKDGRDRLTPAGVQTNFEKIAQSIPAAVLQGVAGSGTVFDTGTGTWTWPGGTPKSDATDVTHALGGVPLAVFVFPNQTQGATLVLSAEAYSYTSTQFSTRAAYVGFNPAAASTATFVWLAIR